MPDAVTVRVSRKIRFGSAGAGAVHETQLLGDVDGGARRRQVGGAGQRPAEVGRRT